MQDNSLKRKPTINDISAVLGILGVVAILILNLNSKYKIASFMYVVNDWPKWWLLLSKGTLTITEQCRHIPEKQAIRDCSIIIIITLIQLIAIYVKVKHTS